MKRSGVAQNDLIARLQAAANLDRVDRALAEPHLHAHGLLAIRFQLIERSLTAGLPHHRPPYLEHVGQTLDLDGAIGFSARLRRGACPVDAPPRGPFRW